MKHLVIGQRQKAPNFSAFHWSPHGCLITIGQHFVTTRVVHLPKRTETSLITKSDRSGPNHQLIQLCTACTAWSDLDRAVRALHSFGSWLSIIAKQKMVDKKYVEAVKVPNSKVRSKIKKKHKKSTNLIYLQYLDPKNRDRRC